MIHNPPLWWSLSHWYMWVPLALLLICGLVFIVNVGRTLVETYLEDRDHRLYRSGLITADEYLRRRGARTEQ